VQKSLLCPCLLQYYLNSHMVRVSAPEQNLIPHIRSLSAVKRLILSVQWALIGSSLRVCSGAQVPDVISVLKDSVISLTPVTHRHYPTHRRSSRSLKRTLWDLTKHLNALSHTHTHTHDLAATSPTLKCKWVNECHYIVLYCTFHSSEQ